VKQVLIRQGRVVTEEVPAPAVLPDSVLVAVAHSCVSAGTELGGVRQSEVPLWRRALREPAKVRKAIEMAATQGIARTRSAIEGKLQAGDPTGYSLAGRVLEAGPGVEDLRPGDLVACAGTGHAHHAAVVCVPRNLAVPVPDGLGTEVASTVTLGAIALQGVRRAEPTLGETFVVIGLGILGQLTVQLLRANGCRAIGTDLDPRRVALAVGLGLDWGLEPGREEDVGRVAQLTAGAGADGVIITAASPSDAIVSTAFRMCRRKGRVVLVGDVGLALDRADFYRNELDFRISTSYGPGRYDRRYEEEGLDYPIAYVRWTENRNMEEYLRLAAAGRIEVRRLVAGVFPVERAAEAYAELGGGGLASPIVLLSYPREEAQEARTVPNPYARPSGAGRVRVAVVGAGGFAKGTHLPNLAQLADRFEVRAVVSRGGPNALATARQFGAAYGSTDFRAVLEDPEVDAVLITTRHDLHAAQALAALRAGKHVLLEKPLALTRAELDEIAAFYEGKEEGPAPLLLTGFNRRFSPAVQRCAELTGRRVDPLMVSYRMNAGRLPPDHWTQTAEGGGRNLGEACHVYDLFTFLTGSRVRTVSARSLRPASGYYGPRDNFAATVSFEDGSVASLIYTALGPRELPKERMEVYCDGRALVLDDYRHLSVHGGGGGALRSAKAEKGHREELEAFARAIREGGAWPIPLWQQVQATEIALRVEEQLLEG